jgi:hypothetical protein
VSMSRWVVTALVEDGSWVPVEVEAESTAEAVDCAFSLDWVENVVECQMFGGEENGRERVVPVEL